ncbi:MAG: alpha/beta fold hydrolase [Gammaproteobacteria bacterium]|nr:alpha/beta fold hydrolase [Gammaproteobacteria bacterium]
MTAPIEHRGSTIAWREEGEGAHVTLLHGVGGAMDNWDGVITAFGGALRTLRYDLRGHGESGKPPGPYALDDYVDELRALLDARGVARTHLAGFSFGGMIAPAFALAYPQRVASLTCISAVCGRTEAERAAVLGRARALHAGDAGGNAAAAAERWFTPEFRRAHADVIEGRMRQLLANDPQAYAAAYQVFAESDLADRIADIDAPALIMTGEHDQGSSPRMARLMHERIAGSRLEILPGLRHSVLIEAPGLVAGRLREFVEAQ